MGHGSIRTAPLGTGHFHTVVFNLAAQCNNLEAVSSTPLGSWCSPPTICPSSKTPIGGSFYLGSKAEKPAMDQGCQAQNKLITNIIGSSMFCHNLGGCLKGSITNGALASQSHPNLGLRSILTCFSLFKSIPLPWKWPPTHKYENKFQSISKSKGRNSPNLDKSP